ncbi:MAG TPA: AAA family ATPase, partial [Kofleriaceae bacterium]|nr:AAA family ATPase [Kofleriaceae bacterium]
MPPPIPVRPRSMVRIDTEPEPPRTVRSPLVGRDDALATLREVVARAVDFQAPQLVTIVGNQGTGKTRLINELIAELAQQRDRKARVFHGAAERDASGRLVRHAAIATLLRDRFELTPSPDDASKLRFQHEIRTVMMSEQVAEMLHFLGAFVGLEFPATPFLRAVSDNAKQHGELARTALRRFVELDATQGPLVLVLDDLQWADDESLALINDLAVGISGSPVVLIAAARPEMLVRSGGWGDGAVDHTRIDLRNLDPET